MEIKRLVSNSPPPVVISHHSIIQKSQYITHSLPSVQAQVPTPTTPDYHPSAMTEPVPPSEKEGLESVENIKVEDSDNSSNPEQLQNTALPDDERSLPLRAPDNFEKITTHDRSHSLPSLASLSTRNSERLLNNSTHDNKPTLPLLATRSPEYSKGHKRMLSTITEDRDTKKTGVMSMADIVNAMPRNESDEKLTEKHVVLTPIKTENPPLVMLDSPTISSSSVSSRRHAHILSEQRRRENINGGFQVLKNAVPFCKGTQDSKATILKKAAEYIAALENELHQLKYQDGMAQAHLHNPPMQAYGPAPGLPSLAEPRYVYAHPVQTVHVAPYMTAAHGPVALGNPPPIGNPATSLPPPSSLHSSPTSAQRPLPFPQPIHSIKPLVVGPSIGPGMPKANSVPFTISRPASTPPGNSQFRYRFNSN